jgi:hypothetical protein
VGLLPYIISSTILKISTLTLLTTKNIKFVNVKLADLNIAMG